MALPERGTEMPGLMVRDPVVSVITPFLNAGHFLAETVESVVGQRFRDWELLLVDDGSSDDSTRIAREAATREPRIRYLEHPGHANRGKSTSRNLGIAAARGRYLAFLDADDVFLDDKLEHQVALLDAGADLVVTYGTTEYWFGWDRDTPAPEPDRIGKLGVTPGRSYDPPALLVGYLRDPGTVPCICALLSRRDTARSVGGFDESIQDLYEDQVFIAKMVLAGAVYVDSHCGERYRQHEASTSAIAEREGRYHPTRVNEPRRVFLEWLEGYTRRVPASDRELDRALKAAMKPYRPWGLDWLLRRSATRRRRD